MSEKDRPNSSKFLESMENSCVFRPRAWAPLKTQRAQGEVVDADRQHGRVKTWRRQVVLKHKRQWRGDKSELGQNGLAEGKSMRPPPSAQHGTAGRWVVSLRLAPLPPSRSRRAFPAWAGRKTHAAPSEVQSGSICYVELQTTERLPRLDLQFCERCGCGERNRLRCAEEEMSAPGVHNQSLSFLISSGRQRCRHHSPDEVRGREPTVKHAVYDAKISHGDLSLRHDRDVNLVDILQLLAPVVAQQRACRQPPGTAPGALCLPVSAIQLECPALRRRGTSNFSHDLDCWNSSCVSRDVGQPPPPASAACPRTRRPRRMYVDLAVSLCTGCSPRGPGSPTRRRSTRRTESAAPADTGLDPGSACPNRALWTLRTSLTPGVFTQDREIRNEAAARRWRGRVT